MEDFKSVEEWRTALALRMHNMSRDALEVEAGILTEAIGRIINVLRSVGYEVTLRDGKLN